MWAFTLAFEFRLEKPLGTPRAFCNVSIAAFGLQPIFAMLMPRSIVQREGAEQIHCQQCRSGQITNRK
jgi:hypothetical protein